MKKIALIIDFNVKINLSQYELINFDIFLVDRLNGKIKGVIKNSEEDLEIEDLSLREFYHTISPNYQDILCLFQVYSIDDISDYLEKEYINKNKSTVEAKLAMYLINYTNHAKSKIVCNTIEMIEAGHSIRDIIVRIHQIKGKDLFSLSTLMTNYLSSIKKYY